MKTLRVTLFAASATAAVGLSGCSTLTGGQGDPLAVLEALGKLYGHCERTVTYAASVGPLNPGSGATVNGSVRCPATTLPSGPP